MTNWDGRTAEELRRACCSSNLATVAYAVVELMTEIRCSGFKGAASYSLSSDASILSEWATGVQNVLVFLQRRSSIAGDGFAAKVNMRRFFLNRSREAAKTLMYEADHTSEFSGSLSCLDKLHAVLCLASSSLV